MRKRYIDELANRLTLLLGELPARDRLSSMDECETQAFNSGYLTSTPNSDNPSQFAYTLFADPGMRLLAARDAARRNAAHAESAIDLVLRLLPSDGHLD